MGSFWGCLDKCEIQNSISTTSDDGGGGWNTDLSEYCYFAVYRNRSGLAINDPVKAAEAMAILQSSQELFAPLNPTINFATGDDFIAKRDTMRGGLNNRFADLSRCLEKYEGKYFIDDTPRAAEFAAFHHMDLSRHLDPDILNSFPRLVQFVKDIESIKTVSAYLENRPELIDVGVEPKLIIDGRPQPTGVQKT